MVLGAVAGLIPKIEGFAPLPAASADAFMAMQGGHMAMYFGAMYQFSKRLIASQTNEKFNKLAANPSELTNMLEPHYKEITQAFTNRLNDPQSIDATQRLVLEKAYELEILKIHQNVQLLKDLPSAYWNAIFDIEKTIETRETPPQTSTGRSPGAERSSPQPSPPPPPPPKPVAPTGRRAPSLPVDPMNVKHTFSFSRSISSHGLVTLTLKQWILVVNNARAQLKIRIALKARDGNVNHNKYISLYTNQILQIANKISKLAGKFI